MRFEDALRDYGYSRCSLAGATLFIGLGHEEGYDRQPIDGMPAGATRFLFVEAPRQADLIARFLASDDVNRAEHLFIGTSHDYARARPPEGYDFHLAVAALAGGRFPSIRTVSLGDMELLFNGHRGYGSLGDIAPVFDALPNMVDLELFGNFALSRPVRHDKLKTIAVWVDDVGVSGGRLSRETVTNLLSSSFPALEEIDLDLEDGDEGLVYSLPEAFPAGKILPALQAFSMTNLSPEDAERVARWREARAASRANGSKASGQP